ncbi:MAG: RNA polymerase sigma factor [Anaerolineae bacterium]
MVESPEMELVEQAKGDPEAFGALYERHVDRIYSYIFHRTGSAQDAEDLTAKTFYQALSNIERYSDRGRPFSAWLYRIAHNLVANWHRDRNRRQVIPLENLIVTGKIRSGPEGLVERNQDQEALREAIRRLHPDRQRLLILKFSEGLSNSEIGQIMGRSEGAIKSLYHRTLVALRQEMRRMGY